MNCGADPDTPGSIAIVGAAAGIADSVDLGWWQWVEVIALIGLVFGQAVAAQAGLATGPADSGGGRGFAGSGRIGGGEELGGGELGVEQVQGA